MAKLDEPDLRALAVALLEEGHRLWPEVVLRSDAERVKGAMNVLLVCSRVGLNIAKRAGMPKDVALTVIDRAKWVPDPVSMDLEFVPAAVVDGEHSIHGVVWECDKVLHHPGTRTKLPRWFIDHYWPELCRRIASGEEVSDRDKEIVMYWTSVARGER